MPYPSHIEQKLEFDQIRHLLLNHCLSETGREYVHQMRFTTKFEVLEKLLHQTNEMKQLLSHDLPFPAEHYYHIDPYLKKAGIEGAFLAEAEWNQIRLMLRTFTKICSYFEERPEQYPHLFILFGGISVNTSISRQIEKIIDETGALRPNASPELSRISADMTAREKEVRRKVNQLYEKGLAQGWLADSGITIRDGRLVLPVLAEFKRNIPGFVHDESATGQTVFIEPTDAFDNNNQIRELQLAYRRERERILIELTNRLRPEIPELAKYQQRMGMADFIRAKGRLAIQLMAEMPLLSRHPGLNWHNAYHPLLKLNHEKNGMPVVPLTIRLRKEKRILVISGPNAGGKSVCLKTTGLLQYMLQCGLLIPCDAHSEAGLFSEMMADIGDEQSIENDLSTYSSHLKHMRSFTEMANGSTLFLIDEFGTGTDPQFGGPLAEAILNRLNQKQAYGVVTTHYSNLKHFASQTYGLENACMLFDTSQMMPLYLLEIGKPGSSYAFEIAQKSGLSSQVIDYAKAKVGDKQKRMDDLLIELERDKKQSVELNKKLSQQEITLRDLTLALNKEKEELEANRKKLLQDARKEALAIITEANSKIENTIRELREKKAETDTIRRVRLELKKDTETLKVATRPLPPTPSPAVVTLKAGQLVRLEGQQETGEIESIRNGKAQVTFGNIKTWVDLNRLTPATSAKSKAVKQTSPGLDLNEKLRSFNSELNLIGTRGEDALKQLSVYIDDAHLLGFRQVRIVHGKGYGILRKLIREFLQRSPFVEDLQNEHIDQGGDGVTIVTMKG